MEFKFEHLGYLFRVNLPHANGHLANVAPDPILDMIVPDTVRPDSIMASLCVVTTGGRSSFDLKPACLLSAF